MYQMELFAPTKLGFVLASNSTAVMRSGGYPTYVEIRRVRSDIRLQVARATFCAKVDGADYSRYPRS